MVAKEIAGALYRNVFQRTSTLALGVMVSVVFFERGFTVFTNNLWEEHNKGKLWKDIEHKYGAAAE